MNSRRTAKAHVTILSQDLAEGAHVMRAAADAAEALGTEMLLALKGQPLDDEGYLLPEVLAATDAAEFAETELQLIAGSKPAKPA